VRLWRRGADSFEVPMLLSIIESRYRAGDWEMVDLSLRVLERKSPDDARQVREMLALALPGNA
jgi:hypothetical protein